MIGIAAATVGGAVAGVTVIAARAKARKAEVVRAAEREAAAELARIEAQRDQRIAEAQRRGPAQRERTAAALATKAEQLEDDEGRLERRERAAERRRALLDEREALMGERFNDFKARQGAVSAAQDQVKSIEADYDVCLERSAGETRGDVLERLGETLSGEAHVAAQRAARALEARAEDRRETEAKRLIDIASQRYGAPLQTNRLVNFVELPKSEKTRERLQADGGAILGLITELTEVKFETREDGNLFLQAPDPFTREIGRLAYERLVKGGNITDETVKKAVSRAHKDLHKIARDAGNRAAKLLKLSNIHPEILFLVGKLLYRTSYTQNQWSHAIETAHLCGMMARDLGLDVRTAHRAALLHDIGKVLWAETEAVGSHAVSGAAFATEHGEVPEIVHPIAAHHADEKPSTPLAHLVAAADALSGARPGARRETIESYGSRVESLQAICADFREIRDAHIMQGGREVRIVVDAVSVDDVGAFKLSSEIAGRIEEELIYPGQIKVTVLREVRASALAR